MLQCGNMQILQTFFEHADQFRDRLLAPFIKNYWPRKLTPNYLTLARVVIALVLFFLLFGVKNSNGALIIPLFIIGILTDLFDGSVARTLSMETEWGKAADPIADRILIIPIAIYTILNYKLLLAAIIVSEVINGLLSMWGKHKRVFFGSNIFGKVKMFLQSVVFAGILIFWPHPANAFFVWILWLSMGFMAASILVKIKDLLTHAKNL